MADVLTCHSRTSLGETVTIKPSRWATLHNTRPWTGASKWNTAFVNIIRYTSVWQVKVSSYIIALQWCKESMLWTYNVCGESVYAQMVASVADPSKLKRKGTLNTRWFLWVTNSPTALNVPQDLKNSGWQRANKYPVLQRCEEWTAMTGLAQEDAKTRGDRSSAGARTHFNQWCSEQQT